VGLEVVALTAMCPFLLIEACTIQAYGWGWLNAWNILDALTSVFQVRVVRGLGWGWGSARQDRSP
jgi:hypothetical protein